MTTPHRLPAEAFPICEYIKDELEARGWLALDLARKMGVTLAWVESMLHEEFCFISTDPRAEHLGTAFGTGSEVWENLDSAYWRWKIAYERNRSPQKY